jgi:hypothetical protein
MSERPVSQNRSRATVRRRTILEVQALEDRALLSVNTFKSNLLVSTGLAIDPAGFVYVGYQPDAFTTAVDKYTSGGALLARFTLDDALPVSLTFDSVDSLLLAIDNVGSFYVIDPAIGNSKVYAVANIGGFAMDTSAIYDVQTKRTDNSLAGAISNFSFTRDFGDIALYNSPQFGSELLLTMESSGYDFVMRVRNWQTPERAILKVLAGSSSAAGGPFATGDIGSAPITVARGVTVNSRGQALTTLPFDPSGSGYGYDIPISFDIDSPSFSAPLGYDGSAAISSRGMTTDSQDDFLIATGPQGSVYTQDTPGVVFLDSNLSHPTAVALPYFATMQDVAVGPGDSNLYMVLPQTDLGALPGAATGKVLFTSYSPPQSQPSPGGSYLVFGKVFSDKNGDGEKNSGETWLADWSVFDDINANGIVDTDEPTARTDASGIYFLLIPRPGGPAGLTIIESFKQSGWKQTSPDTIWKNDGYAVAAASFDSYGILELRLDFGVQQQIATISGTVYDDQNGDGVKDNGEGGSAGWAPFLDANANGTFDPGEHTAVTDSQGRYTFTVALGSYKVQLQPRDGWAETAPGSNWSWLWNVPSVAAGSATQGIDFGVKHTAATLSGAVYNDVNKSGTRDNNDAGLAGWTVFIDANGSTTLDTDEQTAVTDAQGLYSFTVAPGDYTIYVAPRVGWALTSPGPDWTWHYFANQVAAGSTESGFNFGVYGTVQTNVKLVMVPALAAYGNTWTVTAIVSSESGNQVPTGTVQFLVDGSNFGSAVTLVNGQATSPNLAALAPGGYAIRASYSGDSSHIAADSAPSGVPVVKAKLTVTARNESKSEGEADPTFQVSFDGFVLGQDASVLGGSLSFTTAATTASPAGLYPVTPSGLISSNYAFYYMPGMLTVVKPGANTSQPPVTVASITVGKVKARNGKKTKNQTRIVVHYSGAVDARSAQNVANYILTQPGKDKKYGTKDDKKVKIASAQYDPATRTIALVPKGGKLTFSPTLQLRVLGAGIRDSAGRKIDDGSDVMSVIGKGGGTIAG